MKKLLSALLCIAILSPYAAWAKAEERFVILDMPDCNSAVGEAIAYKIEEVVDGSLHEVSNYEVSSDSEQVIIDKENATVKAEKSGIYDITFEYGNFRKKVKFAASENTEEQIKGEPVFSETFDDEIPACFQQLTGAVIREDSEGNRYLYVDARGKILNSGLFGGDLSDYIFEADINMTACYAGTTGQLSVGMRYDGDEDASYRVSHHEKIKYDEEECVVNTQNSEIQSHMLSMAYGKSVAATSWYLPFLQQSPASMFSGTGYSKVYHWKVMITDGVLCARISDPETGETVQEMSQKLEDLNTTKKGVKMVPLSSGATVLGTWSTDFQVDNIKISTMKAFDRLEIVLDKENSDKPGESIGMKIYSVSGEERTILPQSAVEVSCSDPKLEINDGSVKPLEEGEYFIHVRKGTKYALARLNVSGNGSKMEEALSAIELPQSVMADFELPEAEGFDIQWMSSDESVILPQDGIAQVVRSSVGENDKIVTLTAVIRNGNIVKIKECSVTVCAETDDKNAIENAKQLLEISQSVSSNIRLPEIIGDGVRVTWSSSNTGILENDGTVHRQGKDMRVTLTAILEKNQAKESVKFDITVLGTGTSGGSGSGSGSGYGGGGYGRTTPSMEAETQTDSVKNEAFNDLNGFDWAKEAIYLLYDKGIVSGYGDKKYMPQRNVTREEFVTMICRALGLEGSGEACFSDVDASAWYAPYIAAASHHELISGLPDGSFGVGQNIKRQDMAIIVASAMQYQSGETENFADHDAISNYAKQAVYALKSAGVVVGADGMFYPNAFLTRAEAAMVLSKIID